MGSILDDKEKKILLNLARETIKAELFDLPAFHDSAYTDNLQKKLGAFVTLTEDEKLRGCIGYMTGIKPLKETIQDNAFSAAFRDPRFLPLRKDEFEKIKIEISVLSPLKKIESIEEIIPGEHGVFMRLRYNSGTFLPQVASENGWDRETLMTQLCFKAGVPPRSWEEPDCQLYIYTAEVFRE